MENIQTKTISEKDKHMQSRLDDPYRLLHTWSCSSKNKGVFKNLEKQGIIPERGSWKKHEIEQLEHNMKMIQDENPKIDIIVVLYGTPREERTRIFKDINFISRMAYMIKRTFFMIFQKTVIHFKCQFGFKTDALSAMEWSQLEKLALEHNKNWDIISKLMNRHSNELSTRYHQKFNKNNINKGTWSVEETDKLLQIVSRMPPNKIDWITVSDYVGTRSHKSCRSKLTRRPNQGKNMTELQEKVMIIYLHYSDVTDEKCVEWQNLAKLFKFKLNENTITLHWNKLKEFVPMEKRDTFRMVVTYLYEDLCLVADQIKPKINFPNISKNIKIKRSPHWLRAMFLLLRNGISGHEKMTSEEIIIALEEKYYVEASSKNVIVCDSEDINTNLENVNLEDKEMNQMSSHTYNTVLIEGDIDTSPMSTTHRKVKPSKRKLLEGYSDNLIDCYDTYSLDTSPMSAHRRVKPSKRKICELVQKGSCLSPITIENRKRPDKTIVKRNKQFQDLTRDDNDFHIISIDD